jgi:hypothetical protein
MECYKQETLRHWGAFHFFAQLSSYELASDEMSCSFDAQASGRRKKMHRTRDIGQHGI